MLPRRITSCLLSLIVANYLSYAIISSIDGASDLWASVGMLALVSNPVDASAFVLWYCCWRLTD